MNSPRVRFNLPSAPEIVAGIVLVFLGLLILSIVKVLLGLLPAIVAGVVIYLLFGSLIYAGIGFVVVAIIWAIVKHK